MINSMIEERSHKENLFEIKLIIYFVLKVSIVNFFLFLWIRRISDLHKGCELFRRCHDNQLLIRENANVKEHGVGAS